ncbi:MAG TPA: Nif11-like leader peptide family RiPP precursor [Thermoanaerobaculia bacterium]
MSRADLNRLLGDLQKSPDLLEEWKGMAQDPEAAARWAGARGYDLTTGEVEDLVASDRELTDDELEDAAGGEEAWPPPGGGG